MAKPKALIVRAPGTNCDAELVRAFELAGAEPSLLPLSVVLDHAESIASADLIAFPGGFSFGDDVASGRIFAMHVRTRLADALREALQQGTPILGVCNGFQVLAQTGILPGIEQGSRSIALAENEGARFIDKWSGMVPDPQSPCVWTQGLDAFDPDLLAYPSAHAEGRFVADTETLDAIESESLVPLRYNENFNGSDRAIAGVCDPSGLAFGLMPHPERFLDWNRFPGFAALDETTRASDTPGLALFKAGVARVTGATLSA